MHASACLGVGRLHRRPAGHEPGRSAPTTSAIAPCTSSASCDGGKVYAQPFSEGGAAAAGKARLGHAGTQGRRRLPHQRHARSLPRCPVRRTSTACCARWTNPAPRSAMRCTWPCPADAAGLSVCGDWDPLGMRGTVSRNLLLQDVFVPDSARLLPEGLYHQATQRYPHMFTTLSPTYMGIAQAAYDFTRAVPARRAARHVAGEAAHVPDQADRRGRDAHQAGADPRAVPAKRARGAHRSRRRHPPAPLCGALHASWRTPMPCARWRCAPAAARRC